MSATRIELNIIMRNLFVVFILLLLTSCVPAVSSETISLDRISANPELSLNDEEVASITGIIGLEQENYIRENRSKIKYLILDSPGGGMQFAYDIAIIVKYSNVITIIPKNGVCESACTFIFQA